MIFDAMIALSRYSPLDPALAEALEYLASTDLSDLPVGRVEIDGSRMFCLVQQYQSRADGECRWESHRRYTDIQCVTAGAERIEISHVDALRESGPYDAEKDRAGHSGRGDFITLRPGFFVVFFPQDAHRACIRIGEREPVRKFCLKVEMRP